jgi:hypothetical protein
MKDQTSLLLTCVSHKRVSHRCASHGVPLIDVPLIGMHLTVCLSLSVHSMGVPLIDVPFMGVASIGVALMDLHLTGVDLMCVALVDVPSYRRACYERLISIVALRSFEASPPHSSLWPRCLLEIPQEIPNISIPIIATNDFHLPETKDLALRFMQATPNLFLPPLSIHE